ncbi:hypothetical protein J5N97_012292 [Dioscorea zingiberensis]|uniref:Uncharacterized protein n=1 Tax=Dioscorea zingiberensis TaxID=325984 RepID=A0A9D5HHP5_9LILI|nr:hypothetical protein J5N97_012292 [Dioscorea zingiberensis]
MPMCAGPLTSCPNEISPSPPTPPSPPISNGTIVGKSSSKLSGVAIAGIAVGSAAGVLLLFALLIFFCNRRGGASRDQPINVAATLAVPKPEPQQQPQPLPPAAAAAPAVVSRSLVFVGGEGMEFDLEDLLRASAKVIAKGTSGTTYKAPLEKGGVVAVKRLRDVAVERGWKPLVSLIMRM